jgi:CubicO group peptidase (beta-lactamase class C family)
MNHFIFAFAVRWKNPGATAVVVLTLAFTAPLLAQPHRPVAGSNEVDFAKAREFIQKEMVESSIPSISVAVARRGAILWEEGFGWADRENRIPATQHTMYYMASVNKSMTALALMILQERKQLDLERPINDYLGRAKLSSPAGNPVDATVRQVANHMAGLTTFNPRNHLSIDETIHRYGVILWPPGERFDYSNLGYKILDELVARVSGKSYSNFLRAEIFWPLGMTHASAGVGPGLEKYVAQRYRTSGGLQPPVEGVYCSAHDLARFGMFCLKAHLPDQKAILPDAAIDALSRSPVSTGDGKYSLGWSIDDELYGYRGVLAQGGTTSAQAWLRLIPSEDIVVVALANNGMMSSRVVHEILSVLLPTYREKRAEAQERKKSPPPKTSESARPLGALAGSWRGLIKTYREDIPLTFSIAESGDVHVKLGSQLATLLSDAKFDGQGLSGRMSGDLGVEEDTGPERYQLEFTLYLRDGALQGAVVTAPYPQLPFWAELKRDPESPQRKP